MALFGEVLRCYALIAGGHTDGHHPLQADQSSEKAVGKSYCSFVSQEKIHFSVYSFLCKQLPLTFRRSRCFYAVFVCLPTTGR